VANTVADIILDSIAPYAIKEANVIFKRNLYGTNTAFMSLVNFLVMAPIVVDSMNSLVNVPSKIKTSDLSSKQL
jgi:hypothetical protein